MNNNKNLIKNSFLLFIRLIITSVFGLVATRILLDILGVSDYGLYNVVGGIVILMGFLNTVMCTTTFRFIAFEMGRNDEAAINKVFNISLLIHLGIALLVILFGLTIGNWYIDNHLNINIEQTSRAKFVFMLSSSDKITLSYSLKICFIASSKFKGIPKFTSLLIIFRDLKPLILSIILRILLYPLKCESFNG